MSKIRVYELAKELQISSKELIELLMNEFSVDVKNHMSVIEDEDAELIKELIGETGSASDKTIVDEYEEILAEEVNNQAKKRKKKKAETPGIKNSLRKEIICPARSGFWIKNATVCRGRWRSWKRARRNGSLICGQSMRLPRIMLFLTEKRN